MPPPTANDEWLAGRRFGLVIDAGSSGSRLQIYSWRDARVVRSEEGPKSYGSLPKVEKGTRNEDEWVLKVEPGISSFADDPSGVASYLVPMLTHARTFVPPSLQHETPIFLLATAGMRLLTPKQQSNVLDAACSFLKFHSHFRIDDPSPSGPCGSSIRIITGEEEGLFGWIAVNYLMDQFTRNDRDRTTYGFLDMGGASTQIAFEPSLEERKKAKNLSDVRLRLVGGEEIHHQVFVTTWLGYGTNQARERYVADAVSRYERSGHSASSDRPIPDPCLPRDLHLSELSAYPGHEDAHSRTPHTLVGTGSFERCLKQVGPLLNKNAPCPDVPCLFNGVHVPHIDFSVSRFIGVSEYWYSSEHVFGLGGAYNFVEFEKAAIKFCGRHWNDILRQHQLSKENGTLGGDGEIEEDGKIVDIAKWGDKVELPRLQMQCFKSAWLINVLHDGLGMPRIVDPGGNPTSKAADLKDVANEKGLGEPILQSLDVIQDTAISWTLGKMVLEASKEVPPLDLDVPPISDPSLNSADGDGFTTHPEPDQVDLGNGKLLPIPSEMFGRYPFELTPFNIFLHVLAFLILSIVAYRLRRSPSKWVRRCLRRSLKMGDVGVADQINLEDGRYLNARQNSFFYLPLPSTSLRWSSMRSHLPRTIASFLSPSVSTSPSSMSGRHMHTPATRAPQLRSFSSSSLKNQNGSAGTTQGSITAPGYSLPLRSSTPPAHLRQDGQQYGGGGLASQQPLYSLPRSRNNSQMNLTMLIPRQPQSRSGSSGQQTPTGASFQNGD